MVDITPKIYTLRYAKAQASVILSSQDALKSLLEKTVPKGDVFEMAKAAGLFAIKKTSDLIPDCHPLPIEYAAFNFKTDKLKITIAVEVKTIYKTGVEVEAMHGVSVAALTIYDMMKPLDKHIEISNIKLVEKKGGKTDFKEDFRKSLTASVVVCSDSISAGKAQDRAGKAIMDKLKSLDLQILQYTIIPDERAEILRLIEQHVNHCDLLVFTGGTGLSPRDITPEVIRPLLDREIPGIEEAIRSYGQLRTPYSMLSRSVAGMIGGTLVLALPGSTNGAKESMDALFPGLLHIFRVLKAERHD